MNLLLSVSLSTSSDCWCAMVTQSTGDLLIPLDRHAEYHKQDRQAQRGDKQKRME